MKWRNRGSLEATPGFFFTRGTGSAKVWSSKPNLEKPDLERREGDDTNGKTAEMIQLEHSCGG